MRSFLTELAIAAGATGVDTLDTGGWFELGLVRRGDNSANSSPHPSGRGSFTCEEGSSTPGNRTDVESASKPVTTALTPPSDGPKAEPGAAREPGLGDDAAPPVTVEAGDVDPTMSDDERDSKDANVTNTVEPKHPTIAFDLHNPTMVRVDDAGGTATVELAIAVSEARADVSGTTAFTGDVAEAMVSATLVPVGSGDRIAGSCTTTAAHRTGDGAVPLDCAFVDVPVGTYAATVMVDGEHSMASREVVEVVVRVRR